jgi:hypothetical protein
MGSRQYILRASPQPGDDAWRFTGIPVDMLAPGRAKNPFEGKTVSFTPEAITLRRGPLTVNRVLAADDPVMFVAASFEDLRSAEFTGKVGAEYMMRLFKEGLWLNGVQYRFYGHSNSQLVRPPPIRVDLVMTGCMSAWTKLLDAAGEQRSRIGPPDLPDGRVEQHHEYSKT